MNRREFMQRYVLAMRAAGTKIDLNKGLAGVHKVFDLIDKELEPFEDLNIKAIRPQVVEQTRELDGNIKTTFSDGTVGIDVSCNMPAHSEEPTIHLTNTAVDKMIISALKKSKEDEVVTTVKEAPKDTWKNKIIDRVEKAGGTVDKIVPFDDTFVDDGLHQGYSVEFWVSIEYRWFTDFKTMPKLVRNMTMLDVREALASALAFRDNDPEGYTKMHGGV